MYKDEANWLYELGIERANFRGKGNPLDRYSDVKKISEDVKCPNCGNTDVMASIRVLDGSAFQLQCMHTCVCEDCGNEHECDEVFYINDVYEEISSDEFTLRAIYHGDFVDRQGVLDLKLKAAS